MEEGVQVIETLYNSSFSVVLLDNHMGTILHITVGVC